MIYLFVDGSNLYAAQYDLFGPTSYIDFSLLTNQIEKLHKITFNKIFFYASYSPKPKYLTVKVKNYLKNEALFYKAVKKTKNIIFFKGYRSQISGKEKEVDVKLACDIVHLAHLNAYDRLYFYSADADFAHALLIARSLNKKITVLALENRLPHRFIYIFPTTVLLFNKVNRFKALDNQKITFLRMSKSCLKRV